MACIYSTHGVKNGQAPRSGYAFLCATLDEIEALPSVQKLLDGIVQSRKNGRPGYPPRAMWRAVCMKYLLNERFTVGFIERLRTSPRLQQICGLDSIPSESTFSRFFSLLSDSMDSDTAITEMVGKLKTHLHDLGEVVAIDSTDIEAYANPNHAPVTDSDATWGRRTTKAKSSKGAKKTEPFFGYKMHALNDVVYGAPLAHVLLPANRNDSPQLPVLVRKTQGMYAWLKPKHLMADRGYDSQANHTFLVGQGVTPIIHIRKPTADDGLYDGLYNKKGAPVCDGKTPMEYLGTSPKTGYHLFRCPPAGCRLKKRSSGAIRYCVTKTHWEDPASNLRVLGVVSRSDPQWRRLYRRRQVIERMFSSLKRSRLLNKHQYVRKRKIEMHVAVSVLTYLATMLTRVQAGDLSRIRHMRVRVRA